MVRDQIRLAGMEQELDSLSGQLANTYEELSLIYQISSGMRINRRAGGFLQAGLPGRAGSDGRAGHGRGCCGEASQRQEPVLYGPLSLPPGIVHRLGRRIDAVLSPSARARC